MAASPWLWPTLPCALWAQGVEGNYLHFETVTASAGEAWTSEIRRVSEEPIKGMQFDDVARGCGVRHGRDGLEP